jgi:uncharacterized membrane protein (UPF0127 family)
MCALALAACGGDSGPSATNTPAGTPTIAVVVLPRIQLSYGAGNLLVEVATTAEQSDRGLGYRDSLFTRGGMLFDLHENSTPFFWMKGMRFALDMVWVGDDKKVVAVTADIPPEPGVPDASLKHYSPPSPVRYVLELNAGDAAKYGIGPGTQLTFQIPAVLLGTPAPDAAGTPASGLPPTPVIGAPQP